MLAGTDLFRDEPRDVKAAGPGGWIKVGWRMRTLTLLRADRNY
jgi:hypothetical protein